MCTIFQGEANDGKDKYDAVCIFYTQTMLLAQLFVFTVHFSPKKMLKSVHFFLLYYI